MKFRKKPVVIEAIQFDSDTIEKLEEIEAFMGSKPNFYDAVLNQDKKIIINTLEGFMTCSFGDWIIKGVNGEFYPIKNDILLKTYEAV